MRNRIKAAVLLFFLAGVVGFSGKEKTNAFYTGYDEKTNSVEAGCNESEITEDFPSPDSIPISENPSYKKTVQVFNVPEASGSKSVSCYVRVSLSYSDADIGKAVKLLGTDTQNWEKIFPCVFIIIKPGSLHSFLIDLYTKIRNPVPV